MRDRQASDFNGNLLYWAKQLEVVRSSDLERQIEKLSVPERILLVEEIWDGIARENRSFELTTSQTEELARRSESFSSGRTWEEIKAEFLKP